MGITEFLEQWQENIIYLHKLFYFLTQEADPQIVELLTEYNRTIELDRQIYLLLRANKRMEELRLEVFNNGINNQSNLQEFISGNRVVENKAIPQLIYFNYPFDEPIDLEKEKEKLYNWQPSVDFFTELIENKLRFKGIFLGINTSSQNNIIRNPIQYLNAFEFSNLYNEDYSFPEIIERYCPLNPEIKEKVKVLSRSLENGIKPKEIEEMEKVGNFKIIIIQKYPTIKNAVPALVKYRPVVNQEYLQLSSELFQLRKKRAEALAKIRLTTSFNGRKELANLISTINQEIEAKNEVISNLQKKNETLQVLTREEILNNRPLSIQAYPKELLGFNNVYYRTGKTSNPAFWLVVFYNGNGRYQPLKDLQREYNGAFPRFDLIRGSNGIRRLIVSAYPQADKELPQLPTFAPQQRDKIDQVKALEALSKLKKKTKRDNIINLPEEFDGAQEQLGTKECYPQFHFFLSKYLNPPVESTNSFSTKFLNLIASQKKQEMCSFLSKTYEGSFKETYERGLPYLREQANMINKAYQLEGLPKELKELIG